MTQKLQIHNSTLNFLIFAPDDADTGLDVVYKDDTIWLSQKLMGQLYGVDRTGIGRHLKNIFETAELDEKVVCANFAHTTQHGAMIDKTQSKGVKYYNLDAIIAVGYRVNSKRATQFRQWATTVLRDFAIKGFVIDKNRLENGAVLGKDYFEELLAEIREIRLSERMFYQKVTDIFATSLDYAPQSPIARDFFATVQNKLHYAIHTHTAAELIQERADSNRPHMGLTSWKNSPDGKITKTDVTNAKNFLTQDELQALGRLVNAYLDLAEDRASRHIPMNMQDWIIQLDKFLNLTDRDILKDAGKVSKEIAKQHAETEYKKFRIEQDKRFESDFDKQVKNIQKQKK